MHPCLKVEPVEPGGLVSSATLQIISFFFKVGAGMLVKKEFSKDTNFAPTSILHIFPKSLRLLLWTEFGVTSLLIGERNR